MTLRQLSWRKKLKDLKNHKLGIVGIWDLSETMVVFSTALATVQAIFFGLGSDGTVGANKAAAAIIGERTEFYNET